MILTTKRLTFKEAASFVLQFGKYKGQTLDDIASSNNGLRYLDWLRGEITSEPTAEALDVYLSDPAIEKELE